MGNNVTLSARYQIIGVFGEYLQIHDTDRNVTLLATPKVYADMKSKQQKEMCVKMGYNSFKFFLQ